MRTAIVVAIVVLFVALGTTDLFAGSPRTGVASLLLGVANGLLLLGGT
jgi:hypothetical protein